MARELVEKWLVVNDSSYYSVLTTREESTTWKGLQQLLSETGNDEYIHKSKREAQSQAYWDF